MAAHKMLLTSQCSATVSCMLIRALSPWSMADTGPCWGTTSIQHMQKDTVVTRRASAKCIAVAAELPVWLPLGWQDACSFDLTTAFRILFHFFSFCKPTDFITSRHRKHARPEAVSLHRQTRAHRKRQRCAIPAAHFCQ